MFRRRILSSQLPQLLLRCTKNRDLVGFGAEHYIEKYNLNNLKKSNFDELYSKHMSLVQLNEDFAPKVADDAFIAPCATLTGNVEIWTKASIWYGVVIRGDFRLVRIGAYTNIQDRTVITESFEELGPDHDGSTIIGHRCTIGHGCYLQGCTVEDSCHIGMGSVLLPGSYMETGSMIGAGTVLGPNDRVPTGELWVGNPARCLRHLSVDEMNRAAYMSEKYYSLSLEHAEEYPKLHNTIDIMKDTNSLDLKVPEFSR